MVYLHALYLTGSMFRSLALWAVGVQAAPTIDGACSAPGAWQNGTSYHGNLPGVVVVADAAACCALCSTTKECAVWTFNQEGRCYRRKAGVKAFANAQAISGLTLPQPPTPPPPPTPVPVPLPPTPAPAPPANPCTTCRGPQWTWDAFPAFFHGSDKNGPGGGFTEQALDTIARFPMAVSAELAGRRSAALPCFPV